MRFMSWEVLSASFYFMLMSQYVVCPVKASDDDYIQQAAQEEFKENDAEEIIYRSPDEELETSSKYFLPPTSGDYKFFAKCPGDCDVILGDDKVIPEEKIISVSEEESGNKRRMAEVASHLFFLQEGQKYLIKTKYTPSNNRSSNTEPELGVVLPDDTKMMPIKQNLYFQNDRTPSKTTFAKPIKVAVKDAKILKHGTQVATKESNQTEIQKMAQSSSDRAIKKPEGTELPWGHVSSATTTGAQSTTGKRKTSKNHNHKNNKKNKKGSSLYKKLDQVGKFIQSMEDQKIQSEKLSNGVNGMVKTLEEHVKQPLATIYSSPKGREGRGHLKSLSLFEVAGVDRSNIEDGQLSSKEKVIINLIEVLKKNLILEDKQRRSKEDLYQKKLDTLFKEVRELKATMGKEKTSIDHDGGEEDEDNGGEDSSEEKSKETKNTERDVAELLQEDPKKASQKESLNDNHQTEESSRSVRGAQRSQPYQMTPTIAASAKRYRQRKHHHHHRKHSNLRIIKNKVSNGDQALLAASQITPSAASVAQMYRGILDTEMQQQVRPREPEYPMMEEGASNFEKSNTNEPSPKTKGQEDSNQLSKESMLKTTSGKKPETTNSIDEEGERTTVNQHQESASNLDQRNSDQKQVSSEHKSIENNHKESYHGEDVNLMKNTASTDVPLVRLVKEEHQLKQNVESPVISKLKNSTNRSDAGEKQTVVNFRTDDLKVLEDNLFAEFEKRIKSKAFDGTLGSLRKVGLARDLSPENVEENASGKEHLTGLTRELTSQSPQDEEQSNSNVGEMLKESTSQISQESIPNDKTDSTAARETSTAGDSESTSRISAKVITPQSFKEKLKNHEGENKETIRIPSATLERLIKPSSSSNLQELTEMEVKNQQAFVDNESRDPNKGVSLITNSGINKDLTAATSPEQLMKMYKDTEKTEDNFSSQENMNAVKQFIAPEFSRISNDSMTSKDSATDTSSENGEFMNEGERASYLAKYKGTVEHSNHENHLDTIFSRKGVMRYSKPGVDSADAHYWSPKEKGDKTADSFLESSKHSLQQVNDGGVQTGFVRSGGASMTLAKEESNRESFGNNMGHKASINTPVDSSEASAERSSLSSVNLYELPNQHNIVVPKESSSIGGDQRLSLDDDKSKAPDESSRHITDLYNAKPELLPGKTSTLQNPQAPGNEKSLENGGPEGRYLVPASGREVKPFSMIPADHSIENEGVNNKALDSRYLVKIRNLLGEITNLREEISSMKRDKVFTSKDKIKLEEDLQHKQSLLENLRRKEKKRHTIARPSKVLKSNEEVTSKILVS